MKLTKTASGIKKLTLSKKEWQQIGKKAGWTKVAQHDEQFFNDDCLRCPKCGSNNIKMKHQEATLCNDCGKEFRGSLLIPIEQFPLKLSDVINKKTLYLGGDLPDDYYSRILATAKFHKIIKVHGYGDSFSFTGNPCDFFYEVDLRYIDKDKDGLESRLSMLIAVSKDGTRSRVFQS